MKQSFIFALMTLITMSVFGRGPDWVQNFGKSAKYPEEIYLTGFGIAALDKNKDKSQCMDISVQNAHKELMNKIYLDIKSNAEMKIKEGGRAYSEVYTSVTTSTSHLKLWGCEVEKFYDKRSRTAYALVYVKRQKLIDHYNSVIKKLNNDITHNVKLGNSARQQGDKSLALKYYLRCYPLFNRLFRAQAIIRASTSTMIDTFAELEKNAIETVNITIADVNKAVEHIKKQPIEKVDDIGVFISSCFKDQLETTTGKLMILPFTFQNTGMSSEFAAFLHENLKNNISGLSGFSIVNLLHKDNANLPVNLTNFETTDSLFFLRGTYWQQSDSIKIMAEICNYQQNQIIAGINFLISLDIIHKSNLAIKPQNFEAALEDQQLFNKGEVTDSGLILEAWTNKGKDGVIFFNDEVMDVYINVNMPCYLRLIYHLANGVRTVLLDNYFIDRSYTNNACKIPLKFICDQPFGVEVLQIFAQTEPFKKVDTELHNGYKILKKDLYSFLSHTRGMKRVVYSDALHTEDRIVITTMEH